MSSVSSNLLSFPCRWQVQDELDASGDGTALVNLCFSEILKLVGAGRSGTGSGSLSALEQRVATARALVRADQEPALNHGEGDICPLLLDFCDFFVSTRMGRVEQADSLYLRCLERAMDVPRTHWLQAVLWWARMERAIGRGDIDTSIFSLQAMSESATAGGHQQFVALARTLEATVSPALNQWSSDRVPLR